MQYGLIAEEVDKVFPDIVVRNSEGQPESVQYDVLPIFLLNEIQKQQSIIDEIKEQGVTIEEMNSVIAELESHVVQMYK
jgi:trimeric autotransporter adhesin